jgi:hypothetical protein
MFLVIEPAVVNSPCPLLSAEAVADFSPQLCMRIPSGSAWIAQELDLSAFTDDAGSVTEGALQRALIACVDTGAGSIVAWRSRCVAGVTSLTSAVSIQPRS